MVGGGLGGLGLDCVALTFGFATHGFQLGHDFGEAGLHAGLDDGFNAVHAEDRRASAVEYMHVLLDDVRRPPARVVEAGE